MVFGVRFVIFKVNVPVPVPLLAWLPLIVGLWLVLQQIPRSVTVAPPSLMTLPPPVAEVLPMLVTLAVVTPGMEMDRVENCTSSP